jgi:hypothetical protein
LSFPIPDGGIATGCSFIGNWSGCYGKRLALAHSFLCNRGAAVDDQTVPAQISDQQGLLHGGCLL